MRARFQICSGCMWRSEDKLWASVVSFCCVVSRVRTQFIGLGSKPLPPLSPLAKPRLDFLFFFIVFPQVSFVCFCHLLIYQWCLWTGITPKTLFLNPGSQLFSCSLLGLFSIVHESIPLLESSENGRIVSVMLPGTVSGEFCVPRCLCIKELEISSWLFPVMQ